MPASEHITRTEHSAIRAQDRRPTVRALWPMTPAERVAAMRRGQLTRKHLADWTGRCPDQVPRINGELRGAPRSHRGRVRVSTPASARAMPSDGEPSGWRMIVCDEISPVLAEHGSSRYETPPQEHARALALVRALPALPEPRRDKGPSQRTRPGGKRTVQRDSQ